jgi:hypothetical protein
VIHAFDGFGPCRGDQFVVMLIYVSPFFPLSFPFSMALIHTPITSRCHPCQQVGVGSILFHEACRSSPSCTKLVWFLLLDAALCRHRLTLSSFLLYVMYFFILDHCPSAPIRIQPMHHLLRVRVPYTHLTNLQSSDRPLRATPTLYSAFLLWGQRDPTTCNKRCP